MKVFACLLVVVIVSSSTAGKIGGYSGGYYNGFGAGGINHIQTSHGNIGGDNAYSYALRYIGGSHDARFGSSSLGGFNQGGDHDGHFGGELKTIRLIHEGRDYSNGGGHSAGLANNHGNHLGEEVKTIKLIHEHGSNSLAAYGAESGHSSSHGSSPNEAYGAGHGHSGGHLKILGDGVHTIRLIHEHGSTNGVHSTGGRHYEGFHGSHGENADSGVHTVRVIHEQGTSNDNLSHGGGFTTAHAHAHAVAHVGGSYHNSVKSHGLTGGTSFSHPIGSASKSFNAVGAHASASASVGAAGSHAASNAFLSPVSSKIYLTPH